MFALLILSVGLAMDAFAVSLVRGSVGPRGLLRAAEVGAAFGLAQGMMPLVGWGLGSAFKGSFEAFDHWIAFGLLLVLGLRMLREAFSNAEPAAPSTRSHFLGLAIAALATSVDAAAAGLALPLLGVAIPVACLTIGGTTAILCTMGYGLGSQVSGALGRRAEAIGGLVLIGVGTKVLVDHLGT